MAIPLVAQPLEIEGMTHTIQEFFFFLKKKRELMHIMNLLIDTHGFPGTKSPTKNNIASRSDFPDFLFKLFSDIEGILHSFKPKGNLIIVPLIRKLMTQHDYTQNSKHEGLVYTVKPKRYDLKVHKPV